MVGTLVATVATTGRPAFASDADKKVASPVIVLPVAPIRPVLGADDRTHLVYELLLVNQSPFVVTVDSVGVLDDVGAVLEDLTGDRLAAVLRVNLFGGKGTTLQPSQSAFVFPDVALDATARVPTLLRHRISSTQSPPAKEITAELGGLTVKPETGVAASVTFTSPSLPVSAEGAVVLAPPVHGGGWVMFRGCCDVASSHRGGTGSYDGAIYLAERFAVDFVRLGSGDHLLTGPGNQVTSYPQYGATIYAVADGTIVSARNDVPEQPPGALPEGILTKDAGGNAVILDVGNGRFAFYAHMQPGSVRVKVGDRVSAGDLIGLIGNSGKTIGPHLHFHVVDAATPSAADGLPFVFSAFTGQGVLADNALMLAFQGEAAPVEREALSGLHRNQHPLNNEVVDFGP